MDTALSETAAYMAHQLEANRLQVSLSPSLPGFEFAGRKIRAVDSLNPSWYQAFCAEYSPSNRRRRRKRSKPDTFIKRQHTLRGLMELAKGVCLSVYAQRLLPFVEKEHHWIQQQIEQNRLFF